MNLGGTKETNPGLKPELKACTPPFCEFQKTSVHSTVKSGVRIRVPALTSSAVLLRGDLLLYVIYTLGPDLLFHTGFSIKERCLHFHLL